MNPNTQTEQLKHVVYLHMPHDFSIFVRYYLIRFKKWQDLHLPIGLVQANITCDHRENFSGDKQANITCDHRENFSSNKQANITCDHRENFSGDKQANITCDHNASSIIGLLWLAMFTKILRIHIIACMPRFQFSRSRLFRACNAIDDSLQKIYVYIHHRTHRNRAFNRTRFDRIQKAFVFRSQTIRDPLAVIRFNTFRRYCTYTVFHFGFIE